IDIRTLRVQHSKIAYEEQAPKSGMNGTVFFSDINGTLTNVTNLREKLAADNVMRLTADAKLMGSTSLHTQWDLVLNAPDARFKVTGKVVPFPITILNPAFEPLSMSSIRSGIADKLEFEINGNHDGSRGAVLLDYHDLKIDVLRKNKEDSLEKKGLV